LNFFVEFQRILNNHLGWYANTIPFLFHECTLLSFRSKHFLTVIKKLNFYPSFIAAVKKLKYGNPLEEWF